MEIDNDIYTTLTDNRYVIFITSLASEQRKKILDNTITNYILNNCTLNALSTSVIISRLCKSSKEWLKSISNSCKDRKLTIVSNKPNCIEFENQSRIIGGRVDHRTIRGFGINLLFMNDLDNVHNSIFDDFVDSIFPTITSGKLGKIIITSELSEAELREKLGSVFTYQIIR